MIPKHNTDVVLTGGASCKSNNTLSALRFLHYPQTDGAPSVCGLCKKCFRYIFRRGHRLENKNNKRDGVEQWQTMTVVVTHVLKLELHKQTNNFKDKCDNEYSLF